MKRMRGSKWCAEDYDDEPRSHGNFGLDPFQRMCVDEARRRHARERMESAFMLAEAILRLEGKHLSEFALSVKERVLSEEIGLDQGIEELKIYYAIRE